MAEEQNTPNEEVKEEVKVEVSDVEIEIADDTPEEDQNRKNLPKELVKTKIIVGMEALGRASDRLRLLQFMSDLANTLGAERLAQYINLDDAIKKFAVANGIDTGGLIKSQEQIQQEAQAQQQQQFANQALADPRVAIEAGRSLANSGATVNANGEIETEE